VGLIVLDRDLNILMVNDAYRNKIWGNGQDVWEGEVVGRPFRDMLRNGFEAGRYPVGDESFEEFYKRRVDEVRGGSLPPRESVLNDGTVFFYSGLPLSDGKYLLCYVDLTEMRKRDRDVILAHEEADRAYKLVLSATDTMPEGLMVLEGDEIVLTNRSLAKLLNVPEEILLPGKTWEESYRATLLQNKNYDGTSIEESLARFREAIASGKDL